MSNMNETNLTGIPELDEYNAAVRRIAELQAHANELRERAMRRAGAMVQAIMDSAGLSPDDILGLGEKKPRKERVITERVPLYRNPENGRTWSGMGREPGWIKGKDREQFRVTAQQ